MAPKKSITELSTHTPDALATALLESLRREFTDFFDGYFEEIRTRLGDLDGGGTGVRRRGKSQSSLTVSESRSCQDI